MEGKEVIKADEAGSMEKVFGENDSMFKGASSKEEQNGESEDMEQLLESEQNGSAVDLTESQDENDKYAEEKPITHLKSMINKRVFQATPELMKRKDLMPCDENGKLVPDHRRFN